MKYLIFPKYGDDLQRRARARNSWTIQHAITALELGHSVFIANATEETQELHSEIFSQHGERFSGKIINVTPPDFVASDPAFKNSRWISHIFSMIKQFDIDLVHTRDPVVANCAARSNLKFFYEYHDEDYQKPISMMSQFSSSEHCIGISVISDYFLREAKGCRPSAFVLPSGYNNANKANHALSEKTRSYLLERSKGRNLIGYTGGLQEERDMDVLAQVICNSPECFFVIGGGHKNDISKFREKLTKSDNVEVLGHLDKEEVYSYAHAMDVNLYLRRSDSLLNTSPIKFSDYHTSPAPIVAAMLPMFKDFSLKIDKKCGIIFYEPSNYASLKSAMNSAVSLGRSSYDRSRFMKEFFCEYKERLNYISSLLQE